MHLNAISQSLHAISPIGDSIQPPGRHHGQDLAFHVGPWPRKWLGKGSNGIDQNLIQWNSSQHNWGFIQGIVRRSHGQRLLRWANQLGGNLLSLALTICSPNSTQANDQSMVDCKDKCIYIYLRIHIYNLFAQMCSTCTPYHSICEPPASY